MKDILCKKRREAIHHQNLLHFKDKDKQIIEFNFSNSLRKIRMRKSLNLIAKREQ